MLQFFLWYLLITLIGWLTVPLANRLFPALADRGFSLARALGILIWGYVFWLMASLGLIQNDAGGLLLGLVLLAGISGATLFRENARKGLADWLKSNARLIITVEVVFFLAFAAWTLVRASSPNIEVAGGEKTMELAFINAILRSPTFPPHDPWLSGYAISYYYFGYVMAAMFAKLTGTLGAVAHNLMSSLIFALSFIGAYGILYNLLAAWRRHHPRLAKRAPSTSLPLVGPLFLLLVSNLEAFLEVLHGGGVFWNLSSKPVPTSAFWSWLGIKDLADAPNHLSWIPDRFIWWWRASRVITDLDLLKNPTEVIDEFPAFSYMLGDLHPHVLAMPFGLLAVALALNLFLGGWRGETNLWFYKLPLRLEGLLVGALVLGGLAFLNTWDILIGFALLAGAYVLRRVLQAGWTWKRLEDIFALCIPVGLAAILLYLPFYVGFQSQAGGILPNLVSPTRGAQLWVMFAPLFLALFAYLLYLWRSGRHPVRWRLGFGLAAGAAIFLWLFSWLLAFIAYKLQPAFVGGLISSQCSSSVMLCFSLTTARRLSYIGGLLTLLALLGPALAFMIPLDEDQPDVPDGDPQYQGEPTPFVLMLVFLAAVLVLAPDFVFLRDLFTSRLNTVFKFYYQAWMLWSLAGAFGVAVLLQELRGSWAWGYRVGLALILIITLAFPFLALPNKTNDFQIPDFLQTLKSRQEAGGTGALQAAAKVWTLDGSVLFSNQYPDDAAAARWLLAAPPGVVAEAASNDAYSDYGRMAVYSGQPGVLGWWWHEYQWRGNLAQLASPLTDLSCRADFTISGLPRSRADDLACLYQANTWETAGEVLSQYNIQYVVIGTLERREYRINEQIFQEHLTPVFQQGQVAVYSVP
jgi:YYY domain-containing protein